MKLWILRPRGFPKYGDPWHPWYDKAFGFVIAAPDEATARALAMTQSGDELLYQYLDGNGERVATLSVWLDDKYSTCVELVAGDEAAIIMRDFASA